LLHRLRLTPAAGTVLALTLEIASKRVNRDAFQDYNWASGISSKPSGAHY
jgi:hypothetical protein